MLQTKTPEVVGEKLLTPPGDRQDDGPTITPSTEWPETIKSSDSRTLLWQRGHKSRSVKCVTKPLSLNRSVKGVTHLGQSEGSPI